MKRAILLLALLPVACSSDGTSIDPDLLAAAQCTGLGLEDLDEIFSEVSEFLASIGGTLPPNVTYDDVSGDFTITMSFGTVGGNVSSGDDISDGIDPGEAASAAWTLTPGVGQTITGTGVFNLARTSTSVFGITGNGSVMDGTCTFDATNVDLDLDLASSLGPVGSFDFTGTTPGGTITGTMSFDGSDTATVNAMFAGLSVTFTIDLNTFTPGF